MKRVSAIKPAGEWAGAIDRVVLDAGDRQRRRIVLKGEQGTEFLLDFLKPVT
ncbi:MAG TPA: urease accessory protein UreE, partial [Pseudolabrys sp.]